MAAKTITISGMVRITEGGLNVVTRAFSAVYTASQYITRDLVIAKDVSNIIVSIAQVSNPGFTFFLNSGGGKIRVNFGGHASADSAASLGYEFVNLFTRMGSGVSGDINFHFANSSTDSATIFMLNAQ